MSLRNPAALIADKLQLDQKIPLKLLKETQSALRLFKLRHPNGSLGNNDNDLRRACALLEYVVRERGGIKIPMMHLSRAACMRERDFIKFHQTVGNFRRASRAARDKNVPHSEAGTIPSLTIKLGSYIQDPNGVAQRALKLFETLTRRARDLPASERGHQLRDIQDHRQAYEASCFFIAATPHPCAKMKSTLDFYDEEDAKRLKIQTIVDASNDFTLATFTSVLQHVQSIFKQSDCIADRSSRLDTGQKIPAKTGASRESTVSRSRIPRVQDQSDRRAVKLLKSNNGLLSQKLATNATTDLLQQANKQLEKSMEAARYEESGSKLRQKRFEDWKASAIADAAHLSTSEEVTRGGPAEAHHRMELVVEKILLTYCL